MTCSSLNLDLFIVRLLSRDGFYLKSQEETGPGQVVRNQIHLTGLIGRGHHDSISRDLTLGERAIHRPYQGL